MSNYNTGNPVPSIDPRDLDDNAKVFDSLLQSSSASVPDRLGVERKTWHQIEVDAAALVSPNVSALAGLTLSTNKGLYATGAGALATYDLSSLGRTLGGIANAAAGRAALNAAASGINGDITSLTGLTTALSVAQGGTGATTSSAARAALAAAASGANTDITSITGSAATLTTSRSISATGDATWTVSFNGSANATAAITLAASGVSAGTYGSVTVSAKGLVTAASVATPIANGGTGATTAGAALTALGAAPLASPALTGTPTVPTAAPGTNTTQAASTAFVASALTVAYVPPTTLVGIQPTWNSASSISVSSGGAYIESTASILLVPSALSLSSLSLTANTWYYLYLYNNAGVAAIELVTTAPAAPFMGTARSKTGDTSRRFLGAFRSNTGTGLWHFKLGNTGMIHYLEQMSAAPFRCLTGGNAATLTAVDLSAVVPPTTTTAELILNNDSASVYFTLTNADGPSGGMLAMPSKTSLSPVFQTTASRTVSYFSPSGAAYIDVSAYGNDR